MKSFKSRDKNIIWDEPENCTSETLYTFKKHSENLAVTSQHTGIP